MFDRFVIGERLRELGALLRLTKGNRFRARAYEDAASTLESTRADSPLLGDPDRLVELPGIGRAIAQVIVEVHRRGNTRQLERLRSEWPREFRELTRIPHVTLRRLRLLHDVLGVETVADLEARCRDGSVERTKGFGPVTVQKILGGIHARAETSTGLSLAAADKEAERVLEYVRSLPDVLHCHLAGDLRRRMETVREIDVALASERPARAIDLVVCYPPLVEVVERTAEHATTRCANDVVLRFFATTPSRYGEMLVRRTGSSAHVAHLERIGVLRACGGDDQRDTATEDAVYRHGGLPFLAPELREDVGEIEAGFDGSLPSRLVEQGDIRGMVHCHTTYSDGRHTIEAMARAADAMGIEYLTITDHSPSASYANGLNIGRLREQWDEIDRVQASVSVRLLRGTESDILADGSLDYDEGTLRRFDVVIASIHNRHKMDREQMTARLLTALQHPIFKIWGHPLGRYVSSRPPVECDMERVLDVAARARVAIEVNGDPHRLDLEPRWQRAARERGIPFVISSDAHSTRQYANLRYGVDMARRGWLAPEQVLNTRSSEDFLDAVRPD